MVRNFNDQFGESDSKSDQCLSFLFWIPVPGGGSPFVALEQLSRDQSAAHLLKSLFELERMQIELYGNAVKPVRANMDCGQNLLAAATRGWNKESVRHYLEFCWQQLRSKGQIDFTGRTIMSWCNTHITESIKRWVKTEFQCGCLPALWSLLIFELQVRRRFATAIRASSPLSVPSR